MCICSGFASTSAITFSVAVSNLLKETALPYMDGDMKEIAKRALSKVAAMTEAEYGELALYAADEV